MLDLSIIIPAYNEAKRITSTLKSTFRYLKRQKWKFEVIVVNDGSTDETLSVVLKLQKHLANLQLISYFKNHGKGYAVQKGVTEASGNFILIMDADSSIPIEELPKLWSWRKNYPIVIGSRFLWGGQTTMKNKWRLLISRAGNMLANLLFGFQIKDTQCGFKLLEKKIAQTFFRNLVAYGFGFDIEILAKAKASSIPIKEVAIFWQEVAGSKVRAVRSAVFTLWELFKIRVMINKK